MNTIEFFMNVANGLFLVGTVLLAKDVIRNRSMLNDFNFTGSVLTFLGTSSMMAYLVLLGLNLSVILAIPTMVFWGIVSFYSYRSKYKK